MNPDAGELCDGVDNDCDGLTDEEPDVLASCDDGNACTMDTCDSTAGCINDDISATCDDGIACTIDSCDAALGCQSESGIDCPKTIGFYYALCLGPHPQDELTQANADCVNDSITHAWVSSVADVCDVLQPDPPDDKCEQAESQFMALMLNLCKGRVTGSESIVSACTNNQTVGESIAEADALLSNAGRTFEDCEIAQCESEEVNSGTALGIPD